ncbi:DUF169 domain-containing protein [Geotalea uraniireducens]|uniref:DUF169 domain-containing protein n=1 Tax=Geotalea uraniireducens (strain Rf4) TaxID=351605 RepID=A5G4J3_GEOUR|nr:DUF169 domain-containing protein [Geotalea uraniireducens]ABQ26711.1 protein of unknown function DUF169 [Geotalea uraniireducens Rf4]
MDSKIIERTTGLLEALGLEEEPLGIFYTESEPREGLSPKVGKLPTREREERDEIDWQAIYDGFSCIMCNVWKARKRKIVVWASAEHYGCPGAAFWLGYNKPQAERVICYLSTGLSGQCEGELLYNSPDVVRQIFEHIDPKEAHGRYCVVKPLTLFEKHEQPELVAFFARPEALCGLNLLAAFVTDDPEVVVSPWGAACGSLVTWPLHYLAKGRNKAVLGGWDPWPRRYFQTDELSFTIPYAMFKEMVNRFEDSFLSTKAWLTVRKKIEISNRVWAGHNRAKPEMD